MPRGYLLTILLNLKTLYLWQKSIGNANLRYVSISKLRFIQVQPGHGYALLNQCRAAKPMPGVKNFCVKLQIFDMFATISTSTAHSLIMRSKPCCHEAIFSRTLAWVFFMYRNGTKKLKISVDVFMRGNWFEVLASFTG